MSNNDDILISKLIEETCTEAIEKDQPNNCIDLRNYFEKRLNEVEFISISDYLNQNHLTYHSLFFQHNSKCYRVVLNQVTLDFPSNWSVFNEIDQADVVYIDQSLNQDFLIDIFAEICGSAKDIALVKDDQHVQLVFLPDENSKDHINWIRNYFDKKNSLIEAA